MQVHRLDPKLDPPCESAAGAHLATVLRGQKTLARTQRGRGAAAAAAAKDGSARQLGLEFGTMFPLRHSTPNTLLRINAYACGSVGGFIGRGESARRRPAPLPAGSVRRGHGHRRHPHAGSGGPDDVLNAGVGVWAPRAARSPGRCSGPPATIWANPPDCKRQAAFNKHGWK